ncbi:Z-ring associated protein ZapG [Vibrio algarum]|uniref:Z-ring associated protein G n=1 Tax=Vibrio algarum TaxID=3020714 RepID=A0ABT4YN57_9VIBR|nr:Z-ring associated protein ZapG [Vibrio sp. KJ40-1]MDB1122975.1 Z-ring associated protein ZapG [Vibrio sp. KJ40-1]
MPWIYGLVGLLVGAILGIIISRIKTPQYKKHQQMKKELATTKFELEQQRQELTDHFSQTSELLDVLGKDYTKLYQHMATTSTEMLANLPEQDQPFAKKLTQVDSDTEQEADTQPKDYAKGATGLLTPEKKEIIEAPEAVKAS